MNSTAADMADEFKTTPVADKSGSMDTSDYGDTFNAGLSTSAHHMMAATSDTHTT